MNKQYSKEELKMVKKIKIKKVHPHQPSEKYKSKLHQDFIPSQNISYEENKYQALVRMWTTGTLIYCWWECKLVQPLWESV